MQEGSLTSRYKMKSGSNQRNRFCSLTGFTYIEMLVVIALVALCFVPLLQMFVGSMEEVSQYSDLGTAAQLGREMMEPLKNLRFTEAQIERTGSVWFPLESGPPFHMNQKDWRVKQLPIRGTNPLEVHIQVFRAEDLDHPLIDLVSLIEDL